VDAAEARCQDRTHFFAVASQMMRHILVDAARARGSAKRAYSGPRRNYRQPRNPYRHHPGIAIDIIPESLSACPQNGYRHGPEYALEGSRFWPIAGGKGESADESKPIPGWLE
jgi:hypothetical protein